MYYESLINEVVTVVTSNGAEIIGRLDACNSLHCVTLSSPRMFVPAEEGYGFAPGVCVSGEPNPKGAVIMMNNITTIQKSHPELCSAWIQMTTGLVV